MINRKIAECVSCGQRIITRTGIGHATKQRHRFACPSCGVEISYVLDLDQKTPNLSYRQPLNANWVDGDELEGDIPIIFYPELMVPKNAGGSMLSPFLATMDCHKDFQSYQPIEAGRRHFKDDVWPVLQRIYTHFERGNYDLMDREIPALFNKAVEVPAFASAGERGEWIQGISRQAFDNFIYAPEQTEPLHHLCARVYMMKSRDLERLAHEYVKSGRMAALWKEIKSVRRQFLALYESLQPLLMVRRYWKPNCQDLDPYELSVKNFEELKGLYIDATETAYRLMVVGLGIHLLSSTGSTRVPTSGGERNIWWFEQVSNGVKETQLSKYKSFDTIRADLDLKLRNGVGHHSAHYDVWQDAVVYVKADDADLKQVSLAYTSFVDKTFRAYCAFEETVVFFQWLFGSGHSRLS